MPGNPAPLSGLLDCVLHVPAFPVVRPGALSADPINAHSMSPEDYAECGWLTGSLLARAYEVVGIRAVPRHTGREIRVPVPRGGAP
ncbi:hypothetical protein GCM10010329_47270 [Streptomyces spiroverticillatus]|uniref:Uncharacterized protein n=1 Tax=Streptomyces finlayi TaxID=67296 RepID=A0A919CB79_9ACTN|nr:hypothetical protein GCM10010329_47270 [Streptomyces spiroverticillatus]GHD00132.1 hypothetical protein GCM10010334_44440 [Streptomyces finlayi]